MAFDQCRFAESLGKYEAIWNVKAKDHGNKERRKAQLQALADECGINVELAETKYTSLRTYFVKQRRKVKESQRNGFGLCDIYRPSWPPYSSLTFLEKTLDLTTSIDMTPDSSIPLSMVDNVRPSLSDNMGLVTMVGSPRSTMPEAVDLPTMKEVRSPVPEVNTIILSMPESSRSPTPSNVASPLPETTMRIPMPESMIASIKTEDKEPTRRPERFPDVVEVRRVDDSPPTSTTLRLENTPSPRSSIISHSPRPSNSAFSTFADFSTPLPSVSTFCPSISSSVSCPPMPFSALPHTVHHPPCPPLPSPLLPPAKLRKRSLPKPDDAHLGVILQDAVDNLRTITGNYREDTNDDVSGFLKMTGYQLRSIQDPIRRMRLMHAIQGLILTELSSSFCKQFDETALQKYNDETDNLVLST